MSTVSVNFLVRFFNSGNYQAFGKLHRKVDHGRMTDASGKVHLLLICWKIKQTQVNQ